MELTYLISANYCKTWSIISALREIIANALDAGAGTLPMLSHDDGTLTVLDGGSGLKPEHLIIGEGETTGDSTIGQFREGLKLAMLVLTREGRKFGLHTGEFSVVRTWMADSGLGVDTLHIELGAGKPCLGTRVEVECTEAEYREASGLFLRLHPRYASYSTERLIPGHYDAFVLGHHDDASLYINGLRCKTDLPTVFDYSVTGCKSTINRDRTDVHFNQHHSRVAGALVEYHSSATEFFKHMMEDKDARYAENAIEANQFKHSGRDTIARSALITALGYDDPQDTRIVVASGTKAVDNEATDEGLTLVNTAKLTPFITRIARELLPNATEKVLELRKDREKRARAKVRKNRRMNKQYGEYAGVDPEALTPGEREMFVRACSLVESMTYSRYGHSVCPLVTPVEYFVFEDEEEEDEDIIGGIWMKPSGNLGVYVKEHTAIGVNRSLLRARGHGNSALEELVGVLLHEYAHAKSGFDDHTREFENVLTDWLGTIACAATQSPTYRRVDPFMHPTNPKRWDIPVDHTAGNARAVEDFGALVEEIIRGLGYKAKLDITRGAVSLLRENNRLWAPVSFSGALDTNFSIVFVSCQTAIGLPRATKHVTLYGAVGRSTYALRLAPEMHASTLESTEEMRQRLEPLWKDCCLVNATVV